MSPGPKVSVVPQNNANSSACLISLAGFSLDFLFQRNTTGLLQMKVVDCDLGERWGEKEEEMGGG